MQINKHGLINFFKKKDLYKIYIQIPLCKQQHTDYVTFW